MPTGRPSKLAPELMERLLAYVRGGAYAWVAAQACGIASATFYRWMDWGRRKPTPKKPNPYWEFRENVLEARSQARVLAETEVRRTDPFKWLRFGPGRERSGEPGWTDSHEVTGPEGGPVKTQVIVDISELFIPAKPNEHDDTDES